MANCKYKKDKHGYFQTKVWDGTYDDRERKKRTTLRTKKSSKELERMVNDFNRKVEERRIVKKSDTSFLQYARDWKTVYKASKEKNTLAMYTNIIEKHFSALQTVKLQDISRIHYQLVINNADGKKRTQQQIKMIFKQVLKSAVVDQFIPANVVDDIFNNVDQIRYSPSERRPLTENEKNAIFEAELSPSDKAFIYILYGCGLRRGEVLALTRFSIDLRRNILTVGHSLAFDGNNPYIKSTKTENGERSVPIPEIISPYIKNYVESMHGEKLFTMSSGGWITKSSYNKMWARILRKMHEVSSERITGLTAHMFRHNYCTNLCYQIPTISIKKIAELLGDTEKMVLEVYNHRILEKEDAFTAVGKALNF